MIMKIRINLYFLRNQKISLIYDIASYIGINHPINEVRQLALKLCYDLQHNHKTIIINFTDDEAYYLGLLLLELAIGSADTRIINWCSRNVAKIERKLK